MSGDGEGKCYFWEWQHPGKVVRVLQAHEGVCIGCEWHPLETSKVATCGWDGAIKYWDWEFNDKLMMVNVDDDDMSDDEFKSFQLNSTQYK